MINGSRCQQTEHYGFIIFTKGSLDSIVALVGVKMVLDLLYKFSCLQINCFKCEIFSSGVPAHVLSAIHFATGFVSGELPVRYLGIPLVSRQLSIKDCRPLIEKSTHQHWSSKFHTYAGRL